MLVESWVSAGVAGALLVALLWSAPPAFGGAANECGDGTHREEFRPQIKYRLQRSRKERVPDLSTGHPPVRLLSYLL